VQLDQAQVLTRPAAIQAQDPPHALFVHRGEDSLELAIQPLFGHRVAGFSRATDELELIDGVLIDRIVNDQRRADEALAFDEAVPIEFLKGCRVLLQRRDIREDLRAEPVNAVT